MSSCTLRMERFEIQINNVILSGVFSTEERKMESKDLLGLAACSHAEDSSTPQISASLRFASLRMTVFLELRSS